MIPFYEKNKLMALVVYECIDDGENGYHYNFGYWQNRGLDINLSAASKLAYYNLKCTPVDIYNVHIDIQYYAQLLNRMRRVLKDKRKQWEKQQSQQY